MADALAPPPAFLDAAARLGLAFDDDDLPRLGRFLALLLEANERFNLTTIREPEAAWARHVLDSLTLLPFLAELGATRVVDVGSGGGLPALPLAICMPDARFPSSYEPVDARAQSRATRLALITSLVGGAIAYPLVGLTYSALLTVALVPLFLVRARRMTRFLGLAVIDECLWVRRGAFHLAWTAVPIAKIQTMAVAMSPFDQRWDMARLVVDVAGASSSDVLMVPYLSHAVAMRHYGQLGRDSAAIELTW